MINNSTTRFSNRVEQYVKYRPSYPKEIIPFLEKNVRLNSSFVIADVGSGTGISSKLFLDNGNKVYAVEPNNEMDHKNLNEQKIAEFFSPHDFMLEVFPNKQFFDFEGVKGRMLSSSYVPDESSFKFESMVTVLQKLFNECNVNNTVEFNYETKAYIGKMKAT